MRKVIRLVLSAILILSCAAGFSACTPPSAPAVYTLTYESGGANGSAPAQQTAKAGDTLVLAENTFAKPLYVFAGWSDGKTTFQAGESFVMPARNAALTAVWHSAPPVPKELEFTRLDGAGIAGRVNADTAPYMGDPFILYEEETETFYLYGTTRMNRFFDSDSGNDGVEEGFRCYSSTNLIDWTDEGMCMTTSDSGWARDRFWAPEVYRIDGRYYMYYTGAATTDDRALRVSVAVSDSPTGPFKDHGASAAFDVGYKSIDCTLFQDPDDGEYYLYFSKDQLPDPAYNNANVSSVMGLKLSDPVTVDRTFNNGQPIQLLSVGHSSVDDHAFGAQNLDQAWEIAENGRYWNEGPFVTKHDGKYYLTYSANNFSTPYYSVGYATSEHPLEGFVKPADAQLIGVSKDDFNWSYFAGTGHHMFLEVGGEKLIVYHRFLDANRTKRAVWIDRWGYDGEGRMYINGPTKTAQPLPARISGNRNIAKNAAIKIDGSADSAAAMLTDGAIATYRKYASFREYEFAAGTHRVSLNFGATQNIAGIVIYASTDSAYKLTKVESVTFDGCDYVAGMTFQGASNTPIWIGSNASALFKSPVKAKTIEIEVSAKGAFRLSDIMVLAAD